MLRSLFVFLAFHAVHLIGRVVRRTPQFSPNSPCLHPWISRHFRPRGRLAQLVRALASHARGHKFESCTAHHGLSSPNTTEDGVRSGFSNKRDWGSSPVAEIGSIFRVSEPSPTLDQWSWGGGSLCKVSISGQISLKVRQSDDKLPLGRSNDQSGAFYCCVVGSPDSRFCSRKG